MSVSVHYYVCIGVSMKDLCESLSIEVKNKFELHDVKTGKPTGKFSDGEEVVVAKFHNGKTIEEDEESFPYEVEKMAGKRVEIHGEHREKPEDIFVGIDIIEMDGYSDGVKILHPDQVERVKKEVADIFKAKFGYTGEIYTAAISFCSY